MSSSSPFVPSFAVSSTLIYCCISASLFSFSYSFPVLLVCCFLCLFSFVSSPVIVFTCASFSPAVVTSPVSPLSAVSAVWVFIVLYLLCPSICLFLSGCMFLPPRHFGEFCTLILSLFEFHFEVWNLNLGPKLPTSDTFKLLFVHMMLLPPSTWLVCTEGWLLH